MPISYYEDGGSAPKRAPAALSALILANSLFGLGMIFAWTYLKYLVADPLAWATWMPIEKGYGIIGIFDYPFVLFWAFPFFGVCGAWVGLKGGNKVLAYACVGVPLTLLLLIVGWYYVAPFAWR